VTPRGASAESASAWYVQAAGRVWGPYSQARLEAFVEEGRVAAETLVGLSAEGPFLPAARQARLHRLFGDVDPGQDGPLADVAPLAAARHAAKAAEPAAQPRPLLVWAVLTGRVEPFEAVLAAHGPFVRVGPDLWLVRARLGPAPLRNALSRRLTPADRLMVVEAPLAQAAWFNVEGETDRALRQLWLAADTD